MRSGHTRLVLPALVLLLGVACTSSQGDAPSETTHQAQTPAEPAPTQDATTPAGTEADLAPPEQAQPAPPASAVAPVDRPTTRQARPPVRPTRSSTPAADNTPDRASAPAPADIARPAEVREAAPEAPRPAPTRMVSIPAETRLPLVLQDAIGSDTSAVEDRVQARVASDVVVDDTVVIPEGSRVAGRVTYAQPSGRVKGRAGLTVRFHTLTIGSQTYDITAEPFRREAPGTKAKDVRDIGIGAGAGAVIGGIIGGRKGAGIGAAVGGAGGAGKVLATSGEEVRLAAGTSLTTRLAEPLVVEAARGGSR